MFSLKKHIFLANHNSKFACRRSLSSYRSRNVLTNYKQRCEQQGITFFRTSNDSNLYWKKHFLKNPSYFRT